MLSCIDGAHATSNIWGERWSKLTTNSVGNPVGAMTGQGAQTFAQDPRARLIQVHIAKETARSAWRCTLTSRP
jgi:2-dehydropantoate 2-reductase